jgi:hypothetical protein
MAQGRPNATIEIRIDAMLVDDLLEICKLLLS